MGIWSMFWWQEALPDANPLWIKEQMLRAENLFSRSWNSAYELRTSLPLLTSIMYTKQLTCFSPRLSWDAIPTLFNHGKEIKHKIRVRRSQMLKNETETSVIQVADTEVVDVDHSYCKEEINMECINQSDEEGFDDEYRLMGITLLPARWLIWKRIHLQKISILVLRRNFHSSGRWRIPRSLRKARAPVIVFAENTEEVWWCWNDCELFKLRLSKEN